MSLSLRDQLLKAGLVNEKQAKQADRQKKKQQKLENKGQIEIDEEQRLAALKAMAEKAARDLELNRQQQEKGAKKARDAQIKQLQDSLNAKQTERGTLVTFGDVLFDLDRSELKPGGMHNITKLAQFLQENPDRKVIVEGYTDSTGSAQYNQSLSERRANSVRAALISQGVDPQRIVAQGYGKEYPVASNSDSAGRAMNRRVEVTISNDNKPVAPRSSMSN